MSNSLNPDQDRHSVGPDLDSNCLQRLSATKKAATRKELIVDTQLSSETWSLNFGLSSYAPIFLLAHLNVGCCFSKNSRVVNHICHVYQ